MVVIILTTTVFVQNKCYLFQIDPVERLNTYLKSIKQWLTQTKFKILVVENSGYPFNELQNSDRLEIISFDEGNSDNNSKGASELFSIDYALNHTKFQYDFVIKITGRYFIPKFEEYLCNYNLKNSFCLDILTQSTFQKEPGFHQT